MKTKAIISAVLAAIIIGGGALLLMHNNKNNPSSSTGASTAPSTASSQPPSSNTPAATATPSSGSSTQATGTTETFSITANDTSASPNTIRVKRGDTAKLTFKVSSAGTYHGGLEFKSTDPAVDSGSIAEGSSSTVTFTATKSFKFTPYWYESSVQKDYFVNVDVQ
jgi:FtsP/CotA-like multicopper oxidase with cupredoxin domain